MNLRKSLGLCVLTLAASTLSSYSAIVWEAHNTLSSAKWSQEEKYSDRIQLVNKGGKNGAYRFRLFDGESGVSSDVGRERVELRSKHNAYENSYYYYTWRDYIETLPTGNSGDKWQHIAQIKQYNPNTSKQTMLSTHYSNFRLYDMERGTLWSGPSLSGHKGYWMSTAWRRKVSRNSSSGSTEFWWKGSKKTLSNGSKRLYHKTLWNSGAHANAKFGIYRKGSINGSATRYIHKVRIANSWAGWG